MWLKYSDAPILNGEQWTREQPERLSQYQKPHGFWITDDTADCWRSFCKGGDWGLERLTHKHAVDLDERNILILRTLGGLCDFQDEFGAANWWGPDAEPRKYRDWCIDWRKVAARYDGLIITPYQWDARMSLSWYYTWDCASGCIWNAHAIREIRLIEIDTGIAKPRKAEAA